MKPNIVKVSFEEMKAASNASLTERQKKLASQRAQEIHDGEHDDLVNKARRHFEAKRFGTASAFACITPSRISSIREGLYVGCGYCDACLALGKRIRATAKESS